MVSVFFKPHHLVYEPTPDGFELFMEANGKKGILAELFEYELNLPNVPFPLPKEFERFIEKDAKEEAVKPTMT